MKKASNLKRFLSMTLVVVLLLALIPVLPVSLAVKPGGVDNFMVDKDGYGYPFPASPKYTSVLNPNVVADHSTGIKMRTMNGVPSYCIEVGMNNGDLTAFLDAVDSDAMVKIKSRSNGDEQELLMYRVLLYGYREHSGKQIFLQDELSNTGFSQGAAFIATQLILWEIAEDLRDSATSAPNDMFFYNVLKGHEAESAYHQILQAVANHEARPTSSFYSRSLANSNRKNFIPILDTGIQSGLLYESPTDNMYAKFSNATFIIDMTESVWYPSNSDAPIAGSYTITVKEGVVQPHAADSWLKLTYSTNKFSLQVDKTPESITVDIEFEKDIPYCNDTDAVLFWVDTSKGERRQDRVTGAKADPVPAFMSLTGISSATDIVLLDSNANPEIPSFTLSAEKFDTHGGFDNNTSTPRGDSSLAASWNVEIVTDQGKRMTHTIQANHYGKLASSGTFQIWDGPGDLTRDAQVLPNGQEHEISYTGSAIVTITEIVPEGYLPGTAPISFMVNLSGTAARDVTQHPITGEDICEGEFPEMTTTITRSGLGTVSGNPINLTPTPTAFSNSVKRGQFLLKKSYNKNLDPFSAAFGVKQEMANSQWTIELVSGGDEGHKYLRYVSEGNDGFSNMYRVVTDGSGVSADASNPFITSSHGQILVKDVPYGTYKATEIKAGTEGYVLEVTYFTVSEDDQYLSSHVDDYPVHNYIDVVKKDSETGKTIPFAGTAFRIRYMGNPNSADPTTDPHYGAYLDNGNIIAVGADKNLFYTNVYGKITLPYALPYGLYQLEEIVAPPGYYIGKYGADGVGQIVSGNLGYNDTVTILDGDRNRIDYAGDPSFTYNVYPFSVTGPVDMGAGFVTNDFITVEVPMTNNSVKGKIEVSKVGEVLVGFKQLGGQYVPVYEMKPQPGAVFDIFAAADVLLPDGVDAPLAYDAAGNLIVPKLTSIDHFQIPNAVRIEESTLPDGTQLIYVTETEVSSSNKSYATLVTAKEQGVQYSLTYQEQNGIFTDTWTFNFKLQYDDAGWAYSEVHIEKVTEADGFVGYFPSSDMPEIFNGIDPILLKTASYTNGNSSELLSPVVNQQHVVPSSEIEKVVPTALTLLRPVFAHKYIPASKSLKPATISDLQSIDPLYTDTGDTDYHSYSNGSDFMIAVDNAGTEEFIPFDPTADHDGFEYSNIPAIPSGWTLSVEPDRYTITNGGQTQYAASTFGQVFQGFMDASLLDSSNQFSNKPTTPTDYTIMSMHDDYMWLAEHDSSPDDYLIWAIDHTDGDTLKWLPCDDDGDLYTARTQSLDILLTQAGDATDW